MSHYLFLDLDALLSTIKTHLLAQPTIFPQELTRTSADGVMLRAERLTALLDGQRQQQQPALGLCRYGSYFNESLDNARALRAVGWKLTKKGALDHRSLENLMERSLQQVGASRQSSGAPNTMRCWRQTLDDLGRSYPDRFEVVYLDEHLKGLLASGNTAATGTAPTAAREASLLSQMATDGALWNQVRDRRGSIHPAPHARALALATALPVLPPGPHRLNSSQMSHTKDDFICRQERDAADRRRCKLATLPKVTAMGDRQRYVFLNLDNIAGVLFTSRTLYRCIEGATSPQDVRLDFQALTQHLCGDSTSGAVKCLVAAYWKTSPYLIRALVDIGWTLKAPVSPGINDTGLHDEMMSMLVDSELTEKTLVLAMGDGGLGSTKTNAYREIIGRFLERQWHVEIHAWLHALNDGFVDLQVQYPGRVVVKPLDELVGDLVYLKKRENAKANAFGALGKPANASLNQKLHVSGGSSFEPSHTNYAAGTPATIRASTPTWAHLSASSLRRASPPLPPSPPSQPTVTALQQQIQQMQDSFSALQTSISTEQQLRQENEKLAQSMREQARAFEEERQRQAATALQQACDARLARRLQLEDREESLTCPITCELYVEPVTTVCCGKTFSAEVVKRLSECPWCRMSNLSTHPNRDVASLVELYCADRDELDAEEQETLSRTP
ncbi:hypothetical protein PF001_g11059 [Phytophthora fragariae]|uniref:Uncharacterized protein n=3 Tax=Phytophthora fragariae TaxID=53985 RepID=A0A6A4DW89_9STRA|nr:hypothetical protein PF001_g11059 [Phytophthora fragariae]